MGLGDGGGLGPDSFFRLMLSVPFLCVPFFLFLLEGLVEDEEDLDAMFHED